MDLQYLLTLVHVNEKKRLQIAIQEVPLAETYTSPSAVSRRGGGRLRPTLGSVPLAARALVGLCTTPSVRAAGAHTH